MNGTDLKTLPLNEVRQQYRAYLETQDLSRNTINTICTDSFYLWRNVSSSARYGSFRTACPDLPFR